MRTNHTHSYSRYQNSRPNYNQRTQVAKTRYSTTTKPTKKESAYSAFKQYLYQTSPSNPATNLKKKKIKTSKKIGGARRTRKKRNINKASQSFISWKQLLILSCLFGVIEPAVGSFASANNQQKIQDSHAISPYNNHPSVQHHRFFLNDCPNYLVQSARNGIMHVNDGICLQTDAQGYPSVKNPEVQEEAQFLQEHLASSPDTNNMLNQGLENNIDNVMSLQIGENIFLKHSPKVFSSYSAVLSDPHCSPCPLPDQTSFFIKGPKPSKNV